MRGPDDDAIETQIAGGPPTARAAEAEAPPRPPGGKALLRLLELLASAGYDDAARATVELAVNADEQAAFRERAPAFAALPEGVQLGSGGAARPRGRRRAA